MRASGQKKSFRDADSPFCFSDFLLFFTGFATNRSKKYIKTCKNAAATAAAAAAAATAAATAAAAAAAAATAARYFSTDTRARPECL